MDATTLRWDVYVSPDVLRREQERIFRGAWHYAGPLEWAAEPGERFACAAGDVPIAVVRGRDGVLRAFLNVCRHRGSVIVKEQGRSNTLQCPYHAWTYDLEGALQAAPRSDREDGFDPAGLGLLPALVDTWGPFVFVNADLNAPPLAEALGSLPDLVEPGSLAFYRRTEYAVAANWKIAVENYLECYHCPIAHKGFTALVDVDPDAYRLEAGDGVWSQFGERRADGDGSPSCHFHLVWPALKVNVFPGFANLSIGPVWPVGTEHTAGVLDYFFGPDVSDEQAEGLIAFDDQVGREDTELVESVQRGVRSGIVEHGRLLLDSERLIASFQQRVRDALD
jgi:choline monooxygenase